MKFAGWIFGLALVLEALRLVLLARVPAHPDLLLGVVVIVALSRPAPAGAVAGFFLGLLRDVLYGVPLGTEALPLSLIGWGAGSLGRTVYRESPVTQAVVLFVASVLKGVLVYVLLRGGDQSGIFLYTVRISMPAAVQTAVVVPIGYGILRWLWRERRGLRRRVRRKLRSYEKSLYFKR
jgi:rod shape-determining protein MreD